MEMKTNELTSGDSREQCEHVLANPPICHHDCGGDPLQCVHHGVLLHPGNVLKEMLLSE